MGIRAIDERRYDRAGKKGLHVCSKEYADQCLWLGDSELKKVGVEGTPLVESWSGVVRDGWSYLLLSGGLTMLLGHITLHGTNGILYVYFHIHIHIHL